MAYETELNNLPIALEDAIKQFARAAEATNTKRAYRADFQAFAVWCQTHAVAALPATPLTVCGFLTEQAKAAKAATLSRRVAAIAFVHRATGQPSPIDDHVRKLLKGIRRTLGVAPAAKAALTAEHVKAMVDAMPAAALRNRALILLGFAGAFRRSELGRLRRADLEFRPEGLLVTIGHSKTDQEGAGETIAVARGQTLRHCPVHAVEQLLAATSGEFLFGRAGLSGYRISLIIKQWAGIIGLDAAAIGAHSLRSGFVTSAVMAGAPLLRIMEVTRHKSMSSVRKYYKYELFKDHPGEGLL